MNTQKGSFREPYGSPDFCPHPPTRKTKGPAACNSQTASPFGCLNNFCVEFLSNFLGSLQLSQGVSFFIIPHPERPANESQVGISRFQVRKKATRSQTAERSKIETAVGQRGVQYEIRSAPVCLDKQLPRRSRYAGTCWQKPSCRPCKAFLRNAFCP